MDYAVENVYGKIKNKNVTVSVPGSKSITARALLLAAIARGRSTLKGVSLCDDCLAFIGCLENLGIECEVDGTTVNVYGCGGKLNTAAAEINVGSAGTAARFLPAFLAFQKGEYKIDCSEQMRRRPIEPLVNSLRALGAKITFTEKQNCFPFIIKGTENCARYVEVDITKSSQFLSALLISAACAGKPLTVKPVGEHGRDYINMTLDMMWSFGVNVVKERGAYTVAGEYSPKIYEVEPDVSAACYFYAANRILGADIKVNGLPARSMQGDMKFIELLKDFDGGRVDMGAFSDQALTLAAIAPYFSKPTEICNVAHIRAQECDRIAAICENLGAMGVKCEERQGGVKIYPAAPRSAKIKTFGDHRVAMSFALTGLRAGGIIIGDAQVCSKTFKNYFSELDAVCGLLTAKNN